MGRRNRPYYRIVVADSKSRRDGRFIEQVGTYDPLKNENRVSLKEDRVMYWLEQGAQPTDTVKNILSKVGIMFKWHLRNCKSEDVKKIELQKWEMTQKVKKEEPSKESKKSKEKEKPSDEVKRANVEKQVTEISAESPDVTSEDAVSDQETPEKIEEKLVSNSPSGDVEDESSKEEPETEKVQEFETETEKTEENPKE